LKSRIITITVEGDSRNYKAAIDRIIASNRKLSEETLESVQRGLDDAKNGRIRKWPKKRKA